MYRTYKFRIYPDSEQKEQIEKTFHASNVVYNYFLSERFHKKISYRECSNQLTALKKTKTYSFLGDVYSNALVGTLLELENDFKNFFKEKNLGKITKINPRDDGIDKFYSMSVVKNSIRFVEDKKIKIPKIGDIKIDKYRELPVGYNIKKVTIMEKPQDVFYIKLNCYIGEPPEEIIPDKVFELRYKQDIYIPDQKTINKLEKERKKLKRMKSLSKNWKEQVVKITKLEEKLINQRKDYLHKLSRKFANNNERIYTNSSVGSDDWEKLNELLYYKLQEDGKKLVHFK